MMTSEWMQADRKAGTKPAGLTAGRGNYAAPRTLNRYRYCWGNPMGYMDLMGERQSSKWVQMKLYGSIFSMRSIIP